MNAEGPPLERLTRRLADCPAEMLAEPRIGQAGGVHVAAVVADLLTDLGGRPLTPREAVTFAPSLAAERNRLRTVLIACWLLHDDAFRAAGRHAEAVRRFLTDDVPALAGLVGAEQWVRDAERREELARLALRALDLRPAGESLAQAQDRLVTVSSAERARTIAAARGAEERAQAIREAMRKKAAEEAAAKASRE
jgi:hypothetical protein